MGVAVSDWKLARAVSILGQMGVVSGTAIEAVVARRLQVGDPGGHMRKAFDAFPLPEMAQRVWEKYFVPGGKGAEKPFKARPVASIDPGKPWLELTVISNFVEVFLAKHGHNGVIGINLLEKIQLPTLASLFGAMLAGVDYVLMGAGIPRQMPSVIDALSNMDTAKYRIDVQGALQGEEFYNVFDPKSLGDWPFEKLLRPKFLAIISSTVLAITLLKKISPPVDGFVIEGPLAGGHNAPPRGVMQLDENLEPIYGPKDEPDLEVIRSLGAPFWMAGAYGEPELLAKAIAFGAEGVQIGTAFAFCNESGIDPEYRVQVLEKSLDAPVTVYTDPLASPTGYPFKVIQMDGTLSDQAVYQKRARICDLGYLRSPYRTEDGQVGYRCAAEPQEDFVRKGGDIAETVGRKCICNGLMTTIGLGQIRKDGSHEPRIMTAGNDVSKITRYIPVGQKSYSAEDVINYILAGIRVPATV